MKAVTAHESRERTSGSYHLLNDEGVGSLCGSINEKSQFAADIVEVLPRESAEQHGFDLCGRCAYVADRRAKAKQVVDE